MPIGIDATDAKHQIIKAFHQLLEEKEQLPSKIATKEELAEKTKDKQVVETASTYTVEGIIKGLADLQLHFSGDINELEAKLVNEFHKLDEVQRAIEVETKHFEELRHIRIAAEALNILEQEHQEQAQALEEEIKQERQSLDLETTEKQRQWQKEQKEHEKSNKAYKESINKKHQQEEENRQYEAERKRKIETDLYEEQKRKLQAELAQTTAEKEKDWIEREAILTGHQQLLEEYKAKIQTFPKELDAVVKQTREEAIKTARQTAKVETDLFEKGAESNRKVYETRIQALTEVINGQNGQIEVLSADLGSAMQQIQTVTARVLESASSIDKAITTPPQRKDA